MNQNKSLFNLTKIYQQIDFNEDVQNFKQVTKGSFQWENGHKDTRVIFMPNKNGRFLITWVPPNNLQNKRYIKNGLIIQVTSIVVLLDVIHMIYQVQ